MGKCQRKPLNFSYAFRSFVGYLEGTQKASHTVKNYESDLRTFEKFLQEGLGSKPVGLSQVSRHDLELFHDYLKAQGFKTNTRRRKLLTVRRLLRYLAKRNKIKIDVGRKLPAPGKIERVPLTVPMDSLLEKVRALPQTSELHARNRVLLWTLTETGCQVSELGHLRFESWGIRDTGGAELEIEGKSPRTVPVSIELFQAAQALRSKTTQMESLVFQGHNKFGSLGSPISSRGIELLVRAYAPKLELPELRPRIFRHSAVLHWYLQGVTREVIQARLGLRTPYAFRVFEPLFKSRSETTSSPETPLP